MNDNSEQDKDDKELAESCALEHWADQVRQEMRDGERDGSGRKVREER
jgi:hypothetical protein